MQQTGRIAYKIHSPHIKWILGFSWRQL